MFRPVSAGLDQLLVEAGRNIPFQTPLKTNLVLLSFLILGGMNNTFHNYDIIHRFALFL